MIFPNILKKIYVFWDFFFIIINQFVLYAVDSIENNICCFIENYFAAGYFKPEGKNPIHFTLASGRTECVKTLELLRFQKGLVGKTTSQGNGLFSSLRG